MKRRLCISIVLSTFIAFTASAQVNADNFDQHFRLLPKPQKIEFSGGTSLPYCNGLKFLHLDSVTKRPAVDELLGTLPLTGNGGPGTLTLSLRSSGNLPSSAEGYVLEIKDGSAVITAKAEAGIFYGCQTLLQLMEDARDQEMEIPECRITDYPEVPFRAVHWDLKHHLDITGYYYDLIDGLAKVKINAVIVEFEDKLRYREAPVVGAGNSLSVEEFAAISRYAHERHIELNPLVQGLGHAGFILKHDQYKHLRENPESDWSFSPLDSGTYDLQFALYRDAMAATPYGKYLHIGGDEVADLGVSTLSKESGMKPFELQMHWLRRVCDFAAAHNRIPIFWDDMQWKLADLYESTYDPKMPRRTVDSLWRTNKKILENNLSLFPENCVYMRWNYDHPNNLGNLYALDWYNAHRFKAMGATTATFPWPVLPGDQSNFRAIKDFCRITVEKKLEGILCTVWDDTSPHFETAWRGFYNFGSLTWNYRDIDADTYHIAYRHRFYSPALSDAKFEFQDLLEEALSFWEGALLEKGRRNHSPVEKNLIDLPNPEKPGEWSRKYSDRIQQANRELERYATIRKTIEQNRKLARRGHYPLEIMNSINDFQVYTAKLLVLLRQYDKAKIAAEKNSALKAVSDHVERFAGIRKDLETTYSKTRILENPKGYVLAQNTFHRHLANMSNNTDWMFICELAFNKKLEILGEQTNK